MFGIEGLNDQNISWIYEIEQGFHRLDKKTGTDHGKVVTAFYDERLGGSDEDAFIQDRLYQLEQDDLQKMAEDFNQLLIDSANKLGYTPRWHKVFRTSGYFIFPLKK